MDELKLLLEELKLRLAEKAKNTFNWYESDANVAIGRESELEDIIDIIEEKLEQKYKTKDI